MQGLPYITGLNIYNQRDQVSRNLVLDNTLIYLIEVQSEIDREGPAARFIVITNIFVANSTVGVAMNMFSVEKL